MAVTWGRRGQLDPAWAGYVHWACCLAYAVVRWLEFRLSTRRMRGSSPHVHPTSHDATGTTLVRSYRHMLKLPIRPRYKSSRESCSERNGKVSTPRPRICPRAKFQSFRYRELAFAAELGHICRGHVSVRDHTFAIQHILKFAK